MAAEIPGPSVGLDYVIPAYRAVSPTAVVSLLLGLLAVASFVEPTFFAASALAIVVGLVADRKIRRMPEVYTGRGLAQAGIAMGLVFGLAAGTNMIVNAMIIRRGANAFGREVAKALDSAELERVVHLKMPSDARKELKAGEALERLRKAGASSPDIYVTEVGAIEAIISRIKGGLGHVEFEEVESTAHAGVVPVAGARVRITGPPEPKGVPTGDHAWLELKGEFGTGRWHLGTVKYPYEPKTVGLQSSATSKKGDDDGHGHSH